MTRSITCHRAIRMGMVWCWALIATVKLNLSFGRGVEIEYPVAPVRITEWSGKTGFRFDYLTEDQSSNGEDTHFSNRSFQEFIEYCMRGYIYHPRFLDIRARAQLGLLQQYVKREGIGEDDGDSESNTYLDSYDINLDFFKEHPYSLSLFANRERTPVLQLFTDLEMIESERYGAVLNLKKGPFPMDFSYSESRTKEWGLDSFSESRNRTFEYVLRNQLQQRIFSEFRYRHLDYDQDFHADSDLFNIKRRTQLNSDDLEFLNTIYLNPERTSSLASIFRYFRQSGTQDFENFFWQERLNLRHTEKFNTYYMMSILQNKLTDNTVRTTRGEAGLNYRLFRSLQSHFDLHGRHTDFGSPSEDVYGGTGRLDYRRNTPWGVLSGGYGRTVEEVSRTGETNQQSIIDESLVMRDGDTVFLQHPSALTETIVVTDPSGKITYDENFDYEVHEVGNRTGLRLLVGGKLNDGSPVLVDYEIKVTEDISYISDLQSFNVAYDFERYLKGLSLYYRWQDLQTHDAETADDFSVLTFNDETYGMSYHWRWLTWTEEYQQYRSNFSSYDQLRSELEGYRLIGERLKLGWHAGVTNIDYHDETQPDYSDVNYGGLSLAGRFRDRGFWETEARVRRETGLTDETVFGITGKLGYQWRKLKIEMGGRMEEREREDTSRNQMLVFFQLTREFARHQIKSDR